MIKAPSDMSVGSTHKTKSSGFVKIVEYNGHDDVVVSFIDTGFKKKTTSKKIRSGSIKDNMKPSVFGIGFVGDGRFSWSSHTYIYNVWQGVLQRCYDEKFKTRYPTYKECTICKEWLNFQVFAEWMEGKDYKDKQIDKDIKFKGNKHYSPETCVFISQRENIVAAQAKHHYFTSPHGEVVEVYNLAEFCRQNNLTRETMSKIERGIVKRHKGWSYAPRMCE